MSIASVNPAHLHLLITHVPMLGPIFGLCLLLAAIARRSEELKRTSFWVFVISGLAAIPTYLSGRPASVLLTRMMPGMSTDPGDQHAEIAIVALVAALVLGVMALAGVVLFRRSKVIAVWFCVSMIALSVGTSGLMAWTASLGGQIRHPEIRE